jgi:hypothetical protein
VHNLCYVIHLKFNSVLRSYLTCVISSLNNFFTANAIVSYFYIDYPLTMTSPIVYDVNLESHEKNYCDIQPIIIESNMELTITRWKKRNIFQGQSFRLEWK